VLRIRLAALALLLAVACGDRGPPVWGPNPSASGPPSEACAHARALRDRAPALLDEGRLDRAVRVLQRAEDLCTTEAPATWAPRVRALAAIGRSAEALQLAARIERSDRADDEARRAAAAVRAAAEEHGRAVAERGSRREAPELFDPDAARRAAADALFHRGAEASRAGDHAAAKKLFLDAWEAWHPSPHALVEAGLEARLDGARAEAQALWDRAAYDDATVAVRPELSAGAPSILGAASLAWSPAGDRLAVGGDQEIVIFDAELRPVLRVHADAAVLALAFTADGNRLFAGLDGGAVRELDGVTGAALRSLSGHTAAVRALAVSPDGRALASSGDDGTVRLWDALGGAASRPLRSSRAVVALAFDASSAQLAAAGDDGRIAIWDARTGKLAGTLPARGGAVRAMVFAGSSLDVVTAAERVRWDVADPRRARPASLARARTERASLAADHDGGALSRWGRERPQTPGPLRGAREPPQTPRGPAWRVDPSHTVVAAVAGAALDVGDLTGGSPIATTAATDHGGVVSFALAPGGRALAVLYRDRSLAIVPRAEPGHEPRVLAREGPIDALAPAPDGRTLAAATGGRVLLWSAGGDRLRALDPRGVRALAFSPDGRALALGFDRPRIELHALAGASPVQTFDTAGAIDTLAFSLDGKRLAAGTGAPSVQLFPLGGGEPRALHLETGPVRAVHFSPDGASLLVASKEGVTLWSPSSREGLRFVPYGPEARDVVFTPDGAGMAVADQRGELLLGKPLASAPAPAQRVLVPAQILALAITADGTIATAEGDRSIDLRSPAGKVFQRFHDPDGAVRAVAFLPGHVVAGLGDGSVRLYRAPGPGPAAILRPAPGLGAGKLAGVISSPGGHLEIVGPDAEAARGAIRCRLGAVLYPLDVCAEQFVVEGLLPMVLAGKDPAEAEP
jgi:WD40 repeat protein